MLSLTLSQGSIFGCCLKSVNQEQLVSTRTAEQQIPRGACPRAKRRARDDDGQVSLALTAYLPRPVTTENIHRLVRAIRGGFDPHPEVAAAEARIVADGCREPRNAGKTKHRVHR